MSVYRGDKPADPVLSLKDLSLTRSGAIILDKVSLTIRRGEHWALLGPNGSGKTSILEILNGYLWPMGGTVDVLGDRYGSVDIRDKRKQIGLVSSALFERVPPAESFLSVVLSGKFASLGIFEDIPEDLRKRAEEITEFLGCEGIKDRKYGVLSFGERQRALIGRALMAKPELLILDEPCEGLDLRARENMLGIFDTIIQEGESTLIMVTHRVEEIPPGITHALLIANGRVLASGPKAETISSENISRAMNVKVEILERAKRLYAIAVS